MLNIKYRFTDTEIKKLLATLVIIFDTREQKNQHILDYFDKKKIKTKRQKIDEGDYAGMIPANPSMGIYRDLYFNVAVERKNSVDELVGSIKSADRFENEFDRAKRKGIDIFLVVEEENGIKNMRSGNYRSEYEPKALWGKFNSIEYKYLSGSRFVSKEDAGGRQPCSGVL